MQITIQKWVDQCVVLGQVFTPVSQNQTQADIRLPKREPERVIMQVKTNKALVGIDAPVLLTQTHPVIIAAVVRELIGRFIEYGEVEAFAFLTYMKDCDKVMMSPREKLDWLVYEMVNCYLHDDPPATSEINIDFRKRCREFLLTNDGVVKADLIWAFQKREVDFIILQSGGEMPVANMSRVALRFPNGKQFLF